MASQDDGARAAARSRAPGASIADAHVSLAEIYAIRGDYPAAWRHARAAEQNGNPQAVELLTRYGVSTDTPG